MQPLPTLCLTRPLLQSQRFAAQCRDRLGPLPDIVISPILRIAFLPVPDLTKYSGVIFTSENGARAVRDNSNPIPAYCVGAHTAEIAKLAGFVAYSAGGDVRQLSEMIRRANPNGQILHLRGRHQTGNLVAELQGAGIDADAHIAYEQHEQRLSDAALTLLRGANPVILPLFSVRSAKLVLTQVGPMTESVRVVAISDTVAAACSGRVHDVSIAQSPDVDGMLAEISRRMAA